MMWMRVPSVLTAKQEEARALLASDAKHVLLDGGSRSGKSYIGLRQIITRAVKAPNSRHVVIRFHMKDVKESIGMDTMPKVFANCFPGLEYTVNKQDWCFVLPNKSEIWLAGADDKKRTEKVLGKEFVTMFLNECSQISWDARNMLVTRLAQKATYEYKGQTVVMPPKMIYDCNPPSKAHWSYQVFYQRRNPETKQALVDQHLYAVLKMNPKDNIENISADYVRELEAQSGRMRRRFLEGEYGEVAPGALWTEEMIDTWRHDGEELPDFQRVVVAVDPSGASDEDNKENDEIGIGVAALGVDGIAYILEDLTVKAGPKVWGQIATSAYERHEADLIVGETNYGGDMVRFVVQSSNPHCKFKKVVASRGKVVRAEPIAALHEQGKIRMVGRFIELEEELCAFTTSGYIGARSPNRADWMVWAMTELFPGVMKAEKRKQKKDALERRAMRDVPRGSASWMAS